jgi:serine protease
MKKTIVGLCLTSSLGVVGAAPWLANSEPGASTVNYQVGQENVSLQVQEDVVAVKFKPTRTTSGQQDLVKRLQSDLKGGGRSQSATSATPIFPGYALVRNRTGDRGAAQDIRQRAQKLSYVEETIPVLSEPGSKQPILLPNEMIVKVEGNAAQVGQALDRNNLNLVRPVAFTSNLYLVQPRRARGLAMIDQYRQLQQAPEIKSVSLNLIQNFLAPVQSYDADKPQSAESRSQTARAQSNLRDAQWHFDSRPRRGANAPRTDTLTPEALKTSRQDGKGVVVAVLDSSIQWDHPDLIKNLHDTSTIEMPAPNEKFGWDMVENDADTRLSQTEAEYLAPRFQAALSMSDNELVEQYILDFFQECFNSSATANCVRFYLKHESVHNFHGTHSAGVIAANSKKGATGIAPKAKILPVRVLGLDGFGSQENIMSGIKYAASRKADVINMSLGARIPSAVYQDTITEVLTDNPGLVIVASAGNSGSDPNFNGEISYPAGYEGVVSVGATTIEGRRAYYSSYGPGLDVTAPGGELSEGFENGILTTGGTFGSVFWDGLDPQALKQSNPDFFDAQGQYIFTQGTSFSAPVVSGVVALMKGEDRKRQLTREQMVEILEETSSTENLERLSPSEQKLHYGAGLVNAQAAIRAVLAP